MKTIEFIITSSVAGFVDRIRTEFCGHWQLNRACERSGAVEFNVDQYSIKNMIHKVHLNNLLYFGQARQQHQELQIAERNICNSSQRILSVSSKGLEVGGRM